jgi:valyl-tRNA synthetase
MLKPKIEEKRLDAKAEEKIFKEWERRKVFSFKIKKGRKIFSIDTPPPYVSSDIWHIGAAAHYSQIDMIARTARMLGFNVFFPIGLDRNGLPVEKYVERKYGIKMHETERGKFLELCKSTLDNAEKNLIEIMKKLGLSGDFENCYRTDSEEYRKLTQSTFIDLWNKGLIYISTRPNIYCPGCKTTLSEADVIYKELPSKFFYIKFKVKETNEDIIIATTRPELIFACQLIIFNPEDKRYEKLKDKHAIIPIFEREVPIKPHPYAEPETCTGLEMVCSYGDYADVMLFRELKLKEIRALDENCRLTENAGKYKGLSITEAREKIVEDLKAQGLIVKEEEIMHRVPVCERSGDAIEFIPMEDFYLKQIYLQKKLLEIQKKIKFFPEFNRQILINWINSLTIDWAISRTRYYGTEIPVWYCKKCGKPNLPKKGKYYQPWREKPPFKKCKYCGSNEFEGEEKTFDTWMDSSISPLFISKFLTDKKFFKKVYPNSIRPQGKEIVRTWLYYTLLRCYQLTGKVPWRYAWVSGYCVDEKGEKMSKSKGNVIDPLPIIEKYGADSFRYWAAQEATLGYDFRASEQRVANAGKFLTKLWNIARFISIFPYPKKAKLKASDKWILSELNALIKECLKGYKEFNFFVPATKIREFTWNLFASHYIEMVKARAYGKGFKKEESKAAWFTLHECLKSILLLLAPITPFITEYIWQKLYGKESIHLQTFPKPKWGEKMRRKTGKLVEFNSKVWNEKKKLGLSLIDKIKMEIPKELKEFEEDLRAMHKLE